MMGTNPKVTIASLCALVASVIVTFLSAHVHVLDSAAVLPVVTGLVTLVATYAGGYLKSCVKWAEEYTSAQRAPQAVSLPATAPDSNTDSTGDWA